jgi:hypothetical protein
MNCTVYLPVPCPEEERAVPQCPAVLIDPVVDTDNVREIIFRNIPSTAPFSVIKRYGNVLQDIPAALINPQDDIFDDSLLAPAPLLAAPAALLTVLV